MNFDRSKPHSHGPLVCEVCHDIFQECICIPLGMDKELYTCPSCKADQTLEKIKRTLETNAKLKKLGVLVE